jgi:hypothetical protein
MIKAGLAAQCIDVAKLTIARERIDVAGDELLAQRTAPISGLLQQPRGGGRPSPVSIVASLRMPV